MRSQERKTPLYKSITYSETSVSSQIIPHIKNVYAYVHIREKTIIAKETAAEMKISGSIPVNIRHNN